MPDMDNWRKFGLRPLSHRRSFAHLRFRSLSMSCITSSRDCAPGTPFGYSLLLPCSFLPVVATSSQGSRRLTARVWGVKAIRRCRQAICAQFKLCKGENNIFCSRFIGPDAPGTANTRQNDAILLAAPTCSLFQTKQRISTPLNGPSTPAVSCCPRLRNG